MVVQQPTQLASKVTAWLSFRDVALIGSLFFAGAAWASRMDAHVTALRQDIDPMIRLQSDHERRILVMEERISEWSDIRSRLGDLEKQMARQTAILEQLLIRFDTKGGAD